MEIFNQPKPRGFHHEYMFVDERKERLQDIESRAKRELGMTEKPVSPHEHIRGTFLNSTKHVRRRRERLESGRFLLSFGMIVVLLLVLFAVWKILVS